MGTIVSFHAHPDDESIGCGATIARAVAAGHRAVVVFATRGELGEPVPGVLSEGEQLAVRRSAEVYQSACTGWACAPPSSPGYRSWPRTRSTATTRGG